jgi:hypothetical protein
MVVKMLKLFWVVPEDGYSMFLQNVGICLQLHTGTTQKNTVNK